MANEAINSYLEDRLKSIGLTPETNTRVVEYEGRPQTMQILSANAQDDCLEIVYVRPSGEAETYFEGKKEKTFIRKRFRVAREWKDKEGKLKTARYSQPPKTGIYSYIPSALVAKCRGGKAIKTLIVVEGELKAIAGEIAGLDIAGLGGINNIKDKEANELEENLQTVIKTCKVTNVVYLVDADVFAMAYDDTKDLAQRLSNFYNAVCNFNELVKPLNVDVYFAHIKPKFIETAKGLDDLLALQGIDKTKVIAELEALTTGNKDFFEIQKLSGGYADKLKKYFLLNSVADFYEQFKDIIQDREFHYKGESYYFDGEKVIRNFYKQALNYLRIGTDFYKKVFTLDCKKTIENQKNEIQLEKWKIGEILRDFSDNKNFIKLIPKFDRFVNYPENSKHYKRIIELKSEGITSRFYNRYTPLEHTIESGDWSNIKMFLTHIFSDQNTKGEQLYNFGLDYLKISYENPRQRLPVLCFVSTERNTGKSKFLEFLKLIFKENATILDNERFTGKFTSHFAHKLIIGVDEGFIPIEQKLMKERIKNFSTGSTQWSEAKGLDAQEIDNFCHLILCSNDENNFMQIDEGENRFAVIKVPQIKGAHGAKGDPLLLQKMEKEIPAFLHYLLNEYQLTYPLHLSRFSFDTAIYETEALKSVVERTEKRMNSEIKEFFRAKFSQTEQTFLYYTPDDFCKEYNGENRGFKINQSDFKNYVKFDLHKETITNCRYCLWGLRLNYDKWEAYKMPSKSGTPYKFAISEFFTPNEINQLNEVSESLEIN